MQDANLACHYTEDNKQYNSKPLQEAQIYTTKECKLFLQGLLDTKNLSSNHNSIMRSN